MSITDFGNVYEHAHEHSGFWYVNEHSHRILLLYVCVYAREHTGFWYVCEHAHEYTGWPCSTMLAHDRRIEIGDCRLTMKTSFKAFYSYHICCSPPLVP
jgi:hypothetical protein